MTSLHQLDAGSSRRHVVLAFRGPPHKMEALQPREERVLWRRWLDRHDIGAAYQIARAYRALVVEVVMVHCLGDLPSDALIAEAQIGLMRAICRFSPEKNASFRRYAAPLMIAAIREHLSGGSQR